MAVRCGVEAVAHVDGRFHPITVRVRELPWEQPGVRKASGHAALLNQAEPAPGHAVVLGPVAPRVLMANLLAAAPPGEDLVHELGAAVRPEALDAATDVGQCFYRRYDVPDSS